MTTLDQLQPGQSARVIRIDGADSISARLREMGFVPGRAVRFVRSAAWGGPLNCFVEGCRLALRATEAKRVAVQIES
jgi:ferrous iron transport protein A